MGGHRDARLSTDSEDSPTPWPHAWSWLRIQSLSAESSSPPTQAASAPRNQMRDVFPSTSILSEILSIDHRLDRLDSQISAMNSLFPLARASVRDDAQTSVPGQWSQEVVQADTRVAMPGLLSDLDGQSSAREVRFLRIPRGQEPRSVVTLKTLEATAHETGRIFMVPDLREALSMLASIRVDFVKDPPNAVPERTHWAARPRARLVLYWIPAHDQSCRLPANENLPGALGDTFVGVVASQEPYIHEHFPNVYRDTDWIGPFMKQLNGETHVEEYIADDQPMHCTWPV